MDINYITSLATIPFGVNSVLACSGVSEERAHGGGGGAAAALVVAAVVTRLASSCRERGAVPTSGEWPGGCDAGETGVLTPLINSSGAAALHYGLFIVTIIRPPAPRTPYPPPSASRPVPRDSGRRAYIESLVEVCIS
ncbi:unnamed protein product, partial [Brenthis ino]